MLILEFCSCQLFDCIYCFYFVIEPFCKLFFPPDHCHTHHQFSIMMQYSFAFTGCMISVAVTCVVSGLRSSVIHCINLFWWFVCNCNLSSFPFLVLTMSFSGFLEHSLLLASLLTFFSSSLVSVIGAREISREKQKEIYCHGTSFQIFLFITYLKKQ